VAFDVSLGVAASVGLVPRVGLGPVARFTAHLGALSLGVEARGEWSLGGLAVPPAGGASVQLWRAAGFACARAGALSFCGLVSGGAFAAQGEGLAVSRSGAVPWVAIGARAGADVTLTRRLFLRAVLDVEAPVVRPSLTLDGASQWDASPVAASLGASLGATIP